MEYFDVCDERGLPTGEVVERSVAHSKGILHRTAHVWIIKKRSKDKDSYPGQFDTSSAGHIPAGMEPLESALRELREELGISAGEEQLRFIGTFRTQYEEVFYDEPFRDNEVISVFVYEKPVEPEGLVLQESEVEEVRYFELLEVYEEICRGSDWCCVNPKGMKVLVEYLEEA